MSKNIFSLIKTCVLISNSLFCSVDFLTFSQVLKAHCQSNRLQSNNEPIALVIRGKFIIILTKWVIYMSKNIFCLIQTCALVQKAPNQGRTQGGGLGLGLKPLLELDILQKFYYLRKEINCFYILFAC